MTVADPAGDAPAAGDRDGLPRRGLRRLAEQGPGLLEGPVPSQSLQPLTPVPSPGNDLLKLRWKPEVRVYYARPDLHLLIVTTSRPQEFPRSVKGMLGCCKLYSDR